MPGIFYPKARVNIGFVPFDEVVNADNLIRMSNVPPRSFTVESNDIYNADTFELELDKSLFPLDPRDMRCLAVEIHAADTKGLLTPLTYRTTQNQLLMGHTDKISQKSETDSASTVRCSGRDYSGLLLDEKWQGRRLKLGRPLSELVTEALSIQPALAPLSVVVAQGGSDPIIPAGDRKRGQFYQAQPDTNLLEGLLALAMRGGAILTVQLDSIVIQPPRNVRLSDDPDGRPLFIEGQNLTSLVFERELGPKDLPNIQVQAMHPGTGALVTGQWPQKFRETKRATKSKNKTKKTSNQDINRFTIRHNAPTEAILSQVAKGIFEYFAQQQISVSFTTHDLSIPTARSLKSQEQARATDDRGVFPAMGVRNGVGVRIRIDPGARNLLEKALSPSEKERELMQRHYNEEVAAVLARGHRAVDQTLFVSTATHAYDEDGYTLDVEAMNYITVEAPR